MICYQCGCRLSEHDFCTGCGADVSLYKKILSASNRYYNEGLEKASVRDLTGAVRYLHQSLKLNKNNIEARNLLGLVYFEMGEVVTALSEWVISKNIRPKKNIADDYIGMIQTNQARLDTINQTIKKYNQALAYCYQDSMDLAVIQLKKVLSYNPNFVRAHQLLALLYICSEEWEAAKRELQKCNEIDSNNTTTLRYLREVNHMLAPEEAANVKSSPPKKKSAGNVIRYQSGNETIIQPGRVKESRGASTLFNLGIGVIIGIAIACCLILPAQIQKAKASVKDEVRVVSEQLDAKTSRIDELEQQTAKLTQENKTLEDSLAEYEGSEGALQATDSLLLATSAYLNDPTDVEKIERYMDMITQDEAKEGSAAFKSLYENLLKLAGPAMAVLCYDVGYADYKAEDYDKAIPNLLKAFQYDAAHGEALFHLANSYKKSGDFDNAKEAYVKVIELFPNTEKASRSETYLAEINNAG